MSDAVRRPFSDFMDMLRRLINYRIIIIISVSKEFQSRIVYRKKNTGGQSGKGEIRIRMTSLP